MSDSTIPLADVIQELRSELLAATAAGEGQELRFDVEELNLELQVVVTKGGSAEAGAKGGVKFWVLNAESSAEVQGKYESSRLQKVSLKLKPKTASGEAFDVASDLR